MTKFSRTGVNHDQLLKLCKVQNEWNTAKPTAEILAVLASEEDSAVIVDKIEKIIDKQKPVSIGTALRALNNIANIPNELDADLDGVDALAYHLDASTCEKGIAALQKVLRRFKELN